MNTVNVARGVTMPFLPVKPRFGAPIRGKSSVKGTLKSLENANLLVQPAPTGVRVCLAVVDRRVFIQDGAGRWIDHHPTNTHDYLKLPNNTCLDGYVAHGDFYAADCLTLGGKSLLCRTAGERETVTYQLVKFLGHRWLFARPTARFIKAAQDNLPDYRGLLLKDYASLYTLTGVNNGWVQRLWH